MSLQRSYFSHNLDHHSFQPKLLSIMNDRMGLHINAPENNSCIAVINSMTENYPLAAIDCSLVSDNITFLCENSLQKVKQHWNKMQLSLIKQGTVICQPTWKTIAIFCFNILSYNKGFAAFSHRDGLSWDIKKICTSVF